MKKFATLCLIISCAGNILAQDILSLKNGDRIENIKVLDISDSKITYSQNDSAISIARNSVAAILYADGRYEEIKATIIGNDTTLANAELWGYDAKELQALIDNGEDRKLLLWQDSHYSKECRKKGKKVYYSTFTPIYQETIKEAKRNGASQFDAIQIAFEKAFPVAAKASNETLRECNGGM